MAVCSELQRILCHAKCTDLCCLSINVLFLWCHQITADVINMHLCLILKEKYCAAWVQTAFSHRDEGPQLPWHPAALHQLPRCLQCTRQLPETAAGWRVFCPSGLRGGSSDLWGLWSTESTLGGSGSAHCWGRTPWTTARGAAGFNQEFLEFEWRRGGDGGGAAASSQFGDEVSLNWYVITRQLWLS